MLPPRITSIQCATTEQWNYFTAHCNHATYFHTAEWAELWHRYTNGRLKPAAKLISFGDGVQALLPMSASTEARGLIQQYSSSSTGKYGGWLSDQSLTKSHSEALWAYVSKLNILLRQNPYDLTLRLLDVPWNKIDFTQVLDLTKGFDDVIQGWSKGHYSAAQKSRRDGVEVVTASTLAEWNEYFEVYLDSLKRWGNSSQSRYDRALFEQMFHQASALSSGWQNTKGLSHQELYVSITTSTSSIGTGPLWRSSSTSSRRIFCSTRLSGKPAAVDSSGMTSILVEVLQVL
jgi:hypothetical protein